MPPKRQLFWIVRFEGYAGCSADGVPNFKMMFYESLRVSTKMLYRHD